MATKIWRVYTRNHRIVTTLYGLLFAAVWILGSAAFSVISGEAFSLGGVLLGALAAGIVFGFLRHGQLKARADGDSE